MAGRKNLLAFLERKSSGCTTANAKTNLNGSESGLNNCESGLGDRKLTSKVESVGKPPGKRIRMKQSSFGNSGNLILEVSAGAKGTDNAGRVDNSNLVEQNVQNLQEGVKSAEGVKRRRQRPIRQCVESRRLQRLKEEEGDDVAGGEGRRRVKGVKVKGQCTSPVKQMLDGGGVTRQYGEEQSADFVGTSNCPSPGKGLGEEVVGMATGEHSAMLLGKAGADFFLPTSKRRSQLKEQKSKIGTHDPILGNKDNANSEVALERISKKRKQTMEARIDGSKSSQNLLSQQGSLKRKGSSKEQSSQLDALAGEDGAKLSNVCCDLRLEAKLAAEENARLSAGRQTHPFFMQQKLLLTRGPNITEVEVEVVNQQASRLSDAVLTPCPPFHITQNDQVGDVALDWKGWEFIKSKLSQQHYNNGIEATCQAMPQESAKLLELERFDCFSKVKDVAHNEENFPFLSVDPLKQCQFFGGLSQCSDGLVWKKQQIKQLFAYLKGRSNILASTLSERAQTLNDLCNKCSMEDLEESFSSYYLHRNSREICNGQSTTNIALWTDKYQPESSEEVCGNTESVKFLNDWLRSWHERVFDPDKDCTKEQRNGIQDDDWDWFQDDSETVSKDGDEDGLKNVLLLTGPVGCGKSAAVYACAKEQGFDVIEVNASECRNGVLVKQKFGEAMESHGLNQWSVDDIAGMQVEHFPAKEFMQTKIVVVEKAKTEKDYTAVLNSTICKKFTEREKQIKGVDERRAWSHSRSKALILFEDVDTIFDEDRGFMAALFQLAETAKRPIILTSNRRDPSLPRLLDRLTVEFDLPSLEELVSHVFMVCVAEGVTISPPLVEHSVKCCCRDMRKIITLLQFWCQGKDKFEGGAVLCSHNYGKLSPTYSSILFELYAEHRIMPKVIPWSFPSKLSETINMEISKALDEMKEQELSYLERLVEDHATKDSLLAQIKNKQKNGNQGARKAIMLERISSADDVMQMFASSAVEPDETSKLFQSSNLSSGQHVKRRKHAIVSSDSEDAIFKEAVPAVSETQPLELGKDVSAELSGDSDEMIFSAFDEPSGPSNCRDLREIAESNMTVFRRLKRIQEADLSESSSLKNVSCVPESLLVPETVMDGDVISHLNSGDFGNTARDRKNFLLDMYGPIGVTPELENLKCPDKREVTSVQAKEMEENWQKSALSMSKSVDHCEIATELVVGNGVLVASQTDGTSFDGGIVKSKEFAKLADDRKTDLASSVGNEDTDLLVKHSEPNGLDGLLGNKSLGTLYETLPLMDECSRAGFTNSFIQSQKGRCLATADPVQETWLKMWNCRETLKSLLSLECEDAVSATESVTKLTDIISSSDVLLSSCELDYCDACKPCHGSRNFYLYGDSSPIYCSDDRLEITSTLARHGLWLCAKRCFSTVSHLDNANNHNLANEMLAACIDSVSVGKLILRQKNQEMFWSEECLEIGPSETEQYSRRQERESKLSDALISSVPSKSLFMAKGVAFHEYTSFLGRISKLEEIRLSHTTTLKRRPRGFRHYLNTGPFVMSSENIISLVEHSTFGEAS